MSREGREHAIAEARALLASKRASLCSHGVTHDRCNQHDHPAPTPADNEEDE